MTSWSSRSPKPRHAIRRRRLKRQYWLRKGGEWNIIYEAAIG